MREGGPTSWRESDALVGLSGRAGPPFAVGATLSLPLLNGLFGFRRDGDRVPHEGIVGDPKGPVPGDPASGRSYWLAGSAFVAPALLCASHCVQISAGAGRGYYDYSVSEVQGDIANPYAPAQRTRITRFGIDARLPMLRRAVVVGLTDYVGRLTPAYEDARVLSPMHTVVVSVGVSLGR
ncbi:MAG: hypothetical protein IPJ11_17535 [Gemmatimonadetes bacterium]|nr:hypothetical protein [Gemmatimonadota bacterium]